MNKGDLLQDLSALFSEVLEIEPVTLTESSSANDIAEWDSVNHLVLLHAIEEKYQIKFSLDEMINFSKVGDICDSILAKKAL